MDRLNFFFSYLNLPSIFFLFLLLFSIFHSHFVYIHFFFTYIHIGILTHTYIIYGHLCSISLYSLLTIHIEYTTSLTTGCLCLHIHITCAIYPIRIMESCIMHIPKHPTTHAYTHNYTRIQEQLYTHTSIIAHAYTHNYTRI